MALQPLTTRPVLAEDGSWERISSQELLQTPYFAIRSDAYRLPDGAVKDPYYVVERPDAAIIFPLTADGEVVLVRQYRPPLERMELGLLQSVRSDAATQDIPTVGFLSHVQKDLAVAAREAGCDRVMARSAFTRDLPRILSGDGPADTNDEAGVG